MSPIEVVVVIFPPILIKTPRKKNCSTTSTRSIQYLFNITYLSIKMHLAF